MAERGLILLVMALVAFQLLNAASIEVIQPRYAVVEDNQTYPYALLIGPGQTFAFSINPIVKTGGIFGLGGQWTYMRAIQYPESWKTTDSKIYGNPLQVEITADQNVQDGKYPVLVTVFNEGDKEKIGNMVNILLQVEVRKDIFDMAIDTDRQTVSAGQPAVFRITVTNKGEANDVFEVSAKGVPGWDFKKQIYVAAGEQKTVEYEIVGNEEEVLRPVITVTSTSSPLITKSMPVTVNVETNLLSDFKAANSGVLLFPMAQLAMNGLAALVSLVA